MSKSPELVRYIINFLDKYALEQVSEEFVVPKQYTVERIAGSGSYGVVAVGEDTGKNRKVAIKKNKRVFSHSVEYTKRILREVKICKHIGEHPNVLSLWDLLPVSKDFDDIYEVSEAMDADLSLLINQPDPIPLETIQYFIREILKGLQYLNSGDIIHRDLKPQNILVKEDGTVKICDFGLSRGVSEEKKEIYTKLVQTRWYRAPEQCLGWSQARFAIDVWSVGCIFAELLRPKGRSNRNYALFPADNENMQIIEILKVLGTPDLKELRGSSKDIENLIDVWYSTEQNLRYPPIDLAKLFPQASDDAVDLLKKMLEINPEKRITIPDALKHPFLYDPESENPNGELKCPTFSYEFEDSLKYTQGDKEAKQKVREFEYITIYNEIRDWNLQKHGWDEEGKIVDEVVVNDPDLVKYKEKYPNVPVRKLEEDE